MKPQALTRPTLIETASAISVLGLIGLGALLCAQPTVHSYQIGAYSTDLAGRTPHQRYNARRAAAAINGSIVPPGQVFSFNKALHGWTSGQGFLKAPVSYDGTLIDDYGGGVCETSTTLYNAALLAGLPILERHAHTFAPGYVPAGQDAAVAYSTVDLRFRNPYPRPLTIHVRPIGAMLECRITGEDAPTVRVAVSKVVLDRFAPTAGSVAPGSGLRRTRWHLAGRDGVRVALYRDTYDRHDAHLNREFLSDNTYQAISAVRWRSQ